MKKGVVVDQKDIVLSGTFFLLAFCVCPSNCFYFFTYIYSLGAGLFPDYPPKFVLRFQNLQALVKLSPRQYVAHFYYSARNIDLTLRQNREFEFCRTEGNIYFMPLVLGKDINLS